MMYRKQAIVSSSSSRSMPAVHSPLVTACAVFESSKWRLIGVMTFEERGVESWEAAGKRDRKKQYLRCHEL